LITVLLCTRNRADLLEKAMMSVITQDFSKSDYEILVVDNGSTDQTPETVRRLAGLGPVRYIREERVGLCIARNTGWQAAAGRYVALFDDDALARPGWLRAIRDAFARSRETIGVLGGKVHPIWQSERPAWLADEIAGALTIIDWGPDEKLIEDIGREWLVGANMVAPKAVLAAVGGFHPGLDRVGNNLLSSGDVFFQKEAMRLGYKCLYVPEIAIDHLAASSRLNQTWFVKRFYWQGVSDAAMRLIECPPGLLGRARLALGRAASLLHSPGRIRALVMPTSDPAAFRAKCLAMIDIGFVAGVLGAARR